jgi:hypothetical protein
VLFLVTFSRENNSLNIHQCSCCKLLVFLPAWPGLSRAANFLTTFYSVFKGGTYSLDIDESELLLEFAARKSAVSDISKDIKVCMKIKECAQHL